VTGVQIREEVESLFNLIQVYQSVFKFLGLFCGSEENGISCFTPFRIDRLWKLIF